MTAAKMGEGYLSAAAFERAAAAQAVSPAAMSGLTQQERAAITLLAKQTCAYYELMAQACFRAALSVPA